MCQSQLFRPDTREAILRQLRLDTECDTDSDPENEESSPESDKNKFAATMSGIVAMNNREFFVLIGANKLNSSLSQMAWILGVILRSSQSVACCGGVSQKRVKVTFGVHFFFFGN